MSNQNRKPCEIRFPFQYLGYSIFVNIYFEVTELNYLTELPRKYY